MSPVIRPGAEPPARASVASEMEAIFGAASGRPLPAAKPVAESPLPPALIMRRRRIGAPLIAGAVVLAAGAGVIGVTALRDTAPPPAPSSPLPETLRVVAPVPAPVTIAPTPAAMPPAATPPVAQPPAAVASTTSEPAVETKAPLAPAPRRHAPKAVRYADAAAEGTDAPEDARDMPPPGMRGGPCAGLGGRRRYACTLDALAAADGRLRRAYDSAVVTGVPRRDLLAMRERWGSLRRAAARRPFWVVAQYEDLADEMEAASSRAQ